MDDYDQTLMKLGEWKPFGAYVDQPLEAAVDSGTASEDAGSDAVGVSMDPSVDRRGPDQDQSSSPLFLSHAPPTMVQFLVYASTQQILTDANDCRV